MFEHLRLAYREAAEHERLCRANRTRAGQGELARAARHAILEQIHPDYSTVALGFDSAVDAGLGQRLEQQGRHRLRTAMEIEHVAQADVHYRVAVGDHES